MKKLFFYTILIAQGLATSLTAQEWIEKKSTPFEGKVGSFASALEEGILISCGLAQSGNSNETWLYYTKDDLWIQMEDFPGEPRRTGINGEYNGLVYCGLGWNGSQHFSDIYSFDIDLNTWTYVSNYPGNGSRQAMGVIVDDKLYVFGGKINNWVNEFWVYDLVNDNWQQLTAPVLEGRGAGISFEADGLLYLGLGINDDQDFNDLWSYDPNTNLWLQMANFPGSGRLNASVFKYNNGFVVGGGYDKNINYFDDYYIYNPQTDNWMSVDGFENGKRSLSIGSSSSDSGYIISGWDQNQNYLQDVWQYTQTSSIEEPKTWNIKVGPNPFQNNIQVTSQEVINKLGVFNVLGQKILEQENIKNSNISTVDLENGIYVIKLAFDNHIKTIQLIKN